MLRPQDRPRWLARRACEPLSKHVLQHTAPTSLSPSPPASLSPITWEKSGHILSDSRHQEKSSTRADAELRERRGKKLLCVCTGQCYLLVTRGGLNQGYYCCHFIDEETDAWSIHLLKFSKLANGRVRLEPSPVCLHFPCHLHSPTQPPASGKCWNS